MKHLHSSAQPVEPPWRSAQPPGAQGATAGPGLVNFRTSDTQLIDPIEIDQELARLKRMTRSVTWVGLIFETFLGPKRFKPAMVTLTYREVDAFEPLHITKLLKCIRSWLARRGRKLHYVWVAELQQRGALHYHLLIWLPRGLTLPKPDKQGWWPHGSTRIEWARTNADTPTRAPCSRLAITPGTWPSNLGTWMCKWFSRPTASSFRRTTNGLKRR